MDYSGAGSIKKIFGRQREPYGFVTIHQPQEVKGMEAVFYLKDVLVSEDERRLLQGGLIVHFNFARKPIDRMKAPCPFRATQVRVQDPMEYKGTVARCNQGSLTVFLDVLFKQVRVPYSAQLAVTGDRCIVTISWKQMVRALRKNRDPVGQLVALDRKNLDTKDSYVNKIKDIHTAANNSVTVQASSVTLNSIARSYDEFDDDVFSSNFAGPSQGFSTSRDSRDSDSVTNSSMYSQSSYRTNSISSFGQPESHQRSLQAFQSQYQQMWNLQSRTLSTRQSSVSSCGCGLLGGSIWSTDFVSQTDMRSTKDSRGSSSSGNSSPDSARRDSLGEVGDKWSDADWHMQTIRIAEMALPGKR
ncbi:uncharacterized protein LOC111247901 [Varroa destructor]|uniref:Uncharacterized protein n=1 Tax=Varroa destructor TaxID=109461 RepID=A0A7M7JQ09_VARDE|nr:uncharacterized protein LOC111247901 [Varroa destructor]